MNPKVLITGHPNSGTSFLANLVAEMGFSPGDPGCLKPADDHNPHGYWEHVPLQNYVRGLSGYGDWMHLTGAYPPEPLDFTEEEKRRVALLAEGSGVEVFKETGLPVMYRLFPHDSKYLIIMREEEAIYRSGDYAKRGISLEEFKNIKSGYDWLADYMIGANLLVISYEEFNTDFDAQTLGIANFLGVKPDLPCLRQVWRPRT